MKQTLTGICTLKREQQAGSVRQTWHRKQHTSNNNIHRQTHITITKLRTLREQELEARGGGMAGRAGRGELTNERAGGNSLTPGRITFGAREREAGNGEAAAGE